MSHDTAHAAPAGGPAHPVSLTDLLADLGAVQIVDVRSREEFALGSLPGARNLPDGALEGLAALGLDSSRPVIAVCTRGGGRSQGAAKALEGAGFVGTRYLLGGVVGWKEAGSPVR